LGGRMEPRRGGVAGAAATGQNLCRDIMYVGALTPTGASDGAQLDQLLEAIDAVPTNDFALALHSATSRLSAA
jgi:hypothetical protein